MEYICHHRFRGVTAAGERMTISYGEKFPTIGKFIAAPPAKGICYVTSHAAHVHFARNDDGRGLRRGALTYAIAFAPRERRHSGGKIFRFSEREIAMLQRDYPHFLRQDTGTILFNHAFFNADIDEIEKLAAALGIKIKKGE